MLITMVLMLVAVVVNAKTIMMAFLLLATKILTVRMSDWCSITSLTCAVPDQ